MGFGIHHLLRLTYLASLMLSRFEGGETLDNNKQVEVAIGSPSLSPRQTGKALNLSTRRNQNKLRRKCR